ncbi:hypothetical protein [Kitasatospora aburaviensis]|uniref:ATP-dependent DNA ligase family profile domain-containing protein n=1 Tax=Kitasatospora aburaviensis TaxID=67265 RepID=A0ABW1F4B1_9ACTN
MLPFDLPVPVALARPIEQLPDSAGLDLVQGKVDGWRALVRTGPEARVWSRHGTDLTRAFSDVASAAALLPPAVLDGELIAVTPDGNLSFALLQTRSGKGPRPGAGFAVQVAAFDLLALDDVDTRPLPYEERNRRLVKLLAAGPPQIRPLPVTDDLAEARTWVGRLNGGVEGLLLKPAASRYVGGGYGSGWRKWRERHPVDAVVVGIVPAANPRQQAAVLAQPDARGRLRAVGVSLPLSDVLRAELAPLLRPIGDDLAELPGVVGGLPGSPAVRYLPVEPTIVVEMLVDQARPEFGRYRHRSRVVRRRPDLTPDQIRPATPSRR